MTDEQIIKAADICRTGKCSGCPYHELYTAGCITELMKDVFDLINRREAKIEELCSDKIIAERREKDARELFVNCTRQLEEAKAEIERLKKGVTFTFTIEDFESIKETIISNLDNEIKSEAIKEFADNLKEEMRLDDDCKYDCAECHYDCKDYIPFIDNLVREMTEESE